MPQLLPSQHIIDENMILHLLVVEDGVRTSKCGFDQSQLQWSNELLYCLLAHVTLGGLTPQNHASPFAATSA